MAEERLTDGVRIAQLLASEVTGNHGRLRDLSVTDADPDVEPTPDGALGYELVAGDERIAEAYVQPDRVRVEFRVAPDAAADAAGEAGLRVRPKATRPPRTLVFVESGAQVKRVLPTLEAVLETRDRSAKRDG